MAGKSLTVRSTEPLPPTVRALGWTSFLTDLSSEAIYPLLPAFVMRDLGGTALAVGLIDGIATAVAALVRLPSGAASDALGRRPLVLFGYGISAFVRPLMGLVGTPLGALVVRSADRIGKGIRSAPRDALVTDLVDPAVRGRAFGHIRSLDHLGAALGPLVALLFLWFYPGRERLLFLLTVLPGLVTLAVIWKYVRDAPQRREASAAKTALATHLAPSQRWLLVSAAIWGLGAASEQFLLLRAAEVGVPAGLIPLVWFGVGICKSGSAKLTGRLSDLLSPRPMLAAGWSLFAAAYAGLAATNHPLATLLLVGVVGISYGLFEPAERALVSQLAHADGQGNAFGWYTLVQGLMAVPAGALAGTLWARSTGAAWAFAATAILAGLAALLVIASGRWGDTAPSEGSILP